MKDPTARLGLLLIMILLLFIAASVALILTSQLSGYFRIGLETVLTAVFLIWLGYLFSDLYTDRKQGK